MKIITHTNCFPNFTSSGYGAVLCSGALEAKMKLIMAMPKKIGIKKSITKYKE